MSTDDGTKQSPADALRQLGELMLEARRQYVERRVEQGATAEAANAEWLREMDEASPLETKVEELSAGLEINILSAQRKGEHLRPILEEFAHAVVGLTLE